MPHFNEESVVLDLRSSKILMGNPTFIDGFPSYKAPFIYRGFPIATFKFKYRKVSVNMIYMFLKSIVG